MDKFLKKLFKPEPKAIHVDQCAEHDLTINEAIILDTVGSERALNEFYSKLGAYGQRDGLLHECATIPNSCDHAEIAAVLACAKEAGSKDYEMYMKAKLAEKAYYKRMQATFGNTAKERVEAQKAKLADNARIQDALAQTTDAKSEGCCK